MSTISNMAVEINYTIITASYNSERTIQQTFNSLLKQQTKPDEYVVVDGGSTDGTVELIKKAQQEFQSIGISFKWISEPDNGIYNAWNKGIALSSGKWISFIGSDDEYSKNALTEYDKCIAKNPKADFVTAKAKLVANGKVIREIW